MEPTLDAWLWHKDVPPDTEPTAARASRTAFASPQNTSGTAGVGVDGHHPVRAPVSCLTLFGHARPRLPAPSAYYSSAPSGLEFMCTELRTNGLQRTHFAIGCRVSWALWRL
ncbi:glycine hydroxymethyltransferase [Anopheles sinensis]|uniref:Glycine hydroxymethyltransferase n=1 Tax=Anopheles sinensis TaxID=74873 RepID=A0A084WFE3_ANOSI|nr:glycine hydroxymethyltransferase [Anopheles sinensis]